MNWKIVFQKDFDLEFDELNEVLQNECLAHLKVLEKFGPEPGRPHVDTLKGSKHCNMKEMRFNANNGVWRLAFDPERQGILLICGDKSGGSEKKFYKDLGSVDISFLRLKMIQKCQIFMARSEKTGGVLKHAEDF